MPVSCEASEEACREFPGDMSWPDELLCPICVKESGGRIGDACVGGAGAGENCEGTPADAPGYKDGLAPLRQDGDICSGVAGKGVLAPGGWFFTRNGKILVTSGFMRRC